MRLLDAHTLELKTFVNDIPLYAILSHCWAEEEVLFSDLTDLEQAKRKKGFKKIEKTCERAIEHGLHYAWIDTCCIDKSSSAELSEAINSMFAWYRDCARCYAYLADVDVEEAFSEHADTRKTFANSKWFTRAWTLQELIAPHHAGPIVAEKLMSDSEEWVNRRTMFYSEDWSLLGDDRTLESRISSITGVPKEYRTWKKISQASISMRMSWAAGRQATRPEDIAYSLMGLFDVNMPLLYGEGKLKAFRRLQEAIMQLSEDETLFAWQSTESGTYAPSGDTLAGDPEDFVETKELVPFASYGSVRPHTLTQRGLRMWPRVFSFRRLSILARLAIRPLYSAVRWPEIHSSFAVLRCYFARHLDHTVILPLQHVSGSTYRRIPDTGIFLIVTSFLPMPAPIKQIYIKNSQDPAMEQSSWRHLGFFFRNLPENVAIRQAYPASAWDAKSKVLQVLEYTYHDGGQASMELEFSLVNQQGLTSFYVVFLAVACSIDRVHQTVKTWCYISDTIRPRSWYHLEKDKAGYVEVNLEEFLERVKREPERNEVCCFRADQFDQLDFGMKMSITPTKIFMQDMFVVDVEFLGSASGPFPGAEPPALDHIFPSRHVPGSDEMVAKNLDSSVLDHITPLRRH